jgi:hypothetical protein
MKSNIFTNLGTRLLYENDRSLRMGEGFCLMATWPNGHANFTIGNGLNMTKNGYCCKLMFIGGIGNRPADAAFALIHESGGLSRFVKVLRLPIDKGRRLVEVLSLHRELTQERKRTHQDYVYVTGKLAGIEFQIEDLETELQRLQNG